MKRITFPLLAALLLLPFTPCASAAEAKAQLQELVTKIKGKLGSGPRTEEALAEELKSFDTLLAEHQGEKTEDVAQILFMKAMLYGQVLDQDEKAIALLKQTQTDYPETEAGKKAPQVIAAIEGGAAAKAIKRGLVAGKPFPDFTEKDLDGKPLSVGEKKGKVVLVDFWATWCGPCVGELPNVLAAYGKYHDKGFEIVGISLDQDKDKLTSFIKEKQMPWQQYFDGKGWKNKLAATYGVDSIPATYLLDKEGKIIASGLRGEALDAAIAKALQ